MITYEVRVCIGQDNPDKKVVVKCHDTGVNLMVYLDVRHHGKWMDTFEPYKIPDGATAVLKIAKPDKTYCISDGEIKNGGIFFEMKPQAFTAAGESHAEVSLFGQDGRRLTSATFDIHVDPECICDSTEESKDYIDVMAKQISVAVEAEKNAAYSADAAQSAADRAESAADRAESAAINQPYPNAETGTWWVWDAEAGAYRDSGIASAAYNLTAMTGDTLGGAMADPAEEGDTQPVRIGADHKLYTAPGEGEKEYDYEKIIVLDEAVASYVVDTFDDGSPLELSSLEIISVTTNKTASTVTIKIATDLPYAVSNGNLIANTSGGYTGAEKWMYCWLEAKIKNGECSADFASSVSVTRYGNFYSGIYASFVKLIPGITFDTTTTDIFPQKATKFTSVEVFVPAGSMESGSAIRIRGIKA